MKAILTAAWAAVLFITALPASAAQADYDTRSAKVDYSDLDLTRAQGVSTLQHRVTGAIREVCGGPAYGLQEQNELRACTADASRSARSGINSAIANARQQPWMKSIDSGSSRTGTFSGTIGTASQQQLRTPNAGAVSSTFGKTLLAPKVQPSIGHAPISHR